MSRVTRRQFKICLIGDGYVGKTSIRRKYLDKTFKGNYIPTLGVDFAQKSIEHEGVPTNLVIWDIAGQPLYQSLRKKYYEGSSGLILAYSVIDRGSFDNASKWLVEAHRFMGKLPPLIIVGNKMDLRETALQEDSVTRNEGQEFSKRISDKLGTSAVFIETSALTGENINDAFHALTTIMVEKIRKRAPPVQPRISLPGSTKPTDATDTFIRDTEHIDSPSVSTTASFVGTGEDSERSTMSSVASVSEAVSATVMNEVSQDDEVHEPLSELGVLRGELRQVEKERDAIILELDNTLRRLKNEIQVKKIMYEQLMQQVNLTRNKWTVAYEKYMEVDKQKKVELAKSNKEIEGIMKKIDKIGKKL